MGAPSPTQWLKLAVDELESLDRESNTNPDSYKAYWERHRTLLKDIQHNEQTGTGVSKALTEVTDHFIQNLFEKTKTAYANEYGSEWPHPVSLIALGGYGRQELSPFSDIDLLIIYPQKIRKNTFEQFLRVLNEQLIYPLWDLNFKVSNVYRTINETLEEARRDFRTFNAQMESRLIAGSTKLYTLYHSAYKNFLEHESFQEYLKNSIDSLHYRHKKYENTVFLQEPDIKYSVGGLRDYHTLLWISRFFSKKNTLEGLVKKKFLSENEHNALNQAYDYLLRTRNIFHLENNRAADLLNLELQPTIASALGYTKKDIFERVEVFMHDYYHHAKVIYQITRMCIERLQPLLDSQAKRFSLMTVIESCRSKPRKHIDEFVLCKNTFTYENPNLFKEYPARLIRIFRHCQQHHATLAPELKSLIHESLDLIDENLIKDPSACKSFRSILQSIGEVHPALEQMHELGVLARFIPEFKEITCLVQHEFYHRYTADIHTLNSIKVLDNVFDAKTKDVKHYSKAIRGTTRPSILYIILLLHDIGKATGIKNHSETSVKVAKPILDRLGINSKQQELILFIIKNHLTMTRFWQRFDVDDPEVAASVATFLGDPETLKYLYVHTYCDTQATGADIWNSFKEMLHTKLYKNTLEIFSLQENTISERKEQKKAIYSELLSEHNSSLSKDNLTEIINHHPERYFILTNPEEMKLHLTLIDELQALISKSDCSGSLMPVINWEEDIDQSLTIVTLVTWDRPGLFASLAGAFAAAGLNILSTKAFTRSDKITIDTFYVVETDTHQDSERSLQKVFASKLRSIVVNDADPIPDIIQQAKKASRSIPFTKKPAPKVADIPTHLNVYYELSLNRTIVEIQSNDQIGLLFRIASAISDHGFDITFARIATEHGVANDTFHIQKNNIDESTGTNDLIELREHLNNVLAPNPQFTIA